MAPELYINKEMKPITKDFSKIDIWALGVLLINMLTVDFAWMNIQSNTIEYQKFIKDPQSFFKNQNFFCSTFFDYIYLIGCF
jgi:serine/threonine protein kinase